MRVIKVNLLCAVYNKTMDSSLYTFCVIFFSQLRIHGTDNALTIFVHGIEEIWSTRVFYTRMGNLQDIRLPLSSSFHVM